MASTLITTEQLKAAINSTQPVEGLDILVDAADAQIIALAGPHPADLTSHEAAVRRRVLLLLVKLDDQWSGVAAADGETSFDLTAERNKILSEIAIVPGGVAARMAS